MIRVKLKLKRELQEQGGKMHSQRNKHDLTSTLKTNTELRNREITYQIYHATPLGVETLTPKERLK